MASKTVLNQDSEMSWKLRAVDVSRGLEWLMALNEAEKH